MKKSYPGANKFFKTGRSKLQDPVVEARKDEAKIRAVKKQMPELEQLPQTTGSCCIGGLKEEGQGQNYYEKES